MLWKPTARPVSALVLSRQNAALWRFARVAVFAVPDVVQRSDCHWQAVKHSRERNEPMHSDSTVA